MSTIAELSRKLRGRLVTVRHQYIFEYDLTTGVPLAPGPVDGLDVRFPVALEEIASLQFPGGMREIEGIRRYVEQGERLGVILDGDRVVSRGLVRMSGFVSLEGHRKARALKNGEHFLHFFRTAEGFRGRGLYPTLLMTMLASLATEPTATKAIISCRQDNAASVKGILRAGFSPRHRTVTIGLVGGRIAYTRFDKATSAGPA